MTKMFFGLKWHDFPGIQEICIWIALYSPSFPLFASVKLFIFPVGPRQNHPHYPIAQLQFMESPPQSPGDLNRQIP